MARLTLTLDAVEFKALLGLAQQEVRHPGEQARFIVRAELKRLGYLKQEGENAKD